jgi:hypothetical protein
MANEIRMFLAEQVIERRKKAKLSQAALCRGDLYGKEERRVGKIL